MLSNFKRTGVIFLFFICLYFTSQWLYAQQGFNYFLDNAKANNSELASLKAQRNFFFLESDMIKAVNSAPKVYLSSDYLFAPYLNNNGKLISINPGDKAIGYDVGITNGGLYVFLINIEYPVFNRSQVNNLMEQNKLELAKLDTRITTIELELEHKLANMYFDALAEQARLQNARENLNVLSEQIKLVRALVQHGLYGYIDFKLMEIAMKTDSIDYFNAEITYRLNINQLRSTCGIHDTSIVHLAGYEIKQKEYLPDTSLFLQPYQEDSLSALWQQKVFNNQYRPQVKLFANSGLNSTYIPYLGRHMGMSAGAQLTYTIFDGRQKNINRQQQFLLMNQASQVKSLKNIEIKNQLDGYKKAIENAKKTIEKEKMLKKEYDELLNIYLEELKNAQLSIIDYLNFLQQYNSNKLSLDLHTIEIYKLINEYNYWNH